MSDLAIHGGRPVRDTLLPYGHQSIDEEDIHVAIFFAKTDQLIVLDPVDVFVGKFFGGNVRDLRRLLVARDMLADGMEQMRFTQTDSAVKKQRIVGFARRLRDRQRRGVCEVVIIADDESFESVLWIKKYLRAGANSFSGRLDTFCFRRAGLRGRRCCGRARSDFEFYL